MTIYTAIISILSLTGFAQAWSAVGHQMTGAIAQHHLFPNASMAVRELLPEDWNGNLSRSATWADEVRVDNSTKEKYAWAYQLHFVQVQDSPGLSCGYVQARDCPEGKCVVGAIANYTAQLSNCTLEPETRSEALKFITHFFGDISQPLHACGRLRGGNDAPVAAFDDRPGKLNLHALWDSYVIEKRLKNDFGGSFDQYFKYLLVKAKSFYPEQTNLWTECLGSGPNALLNCPLQWATESDALNCDVVWKAYDENPNADLGKQYYQTAFPIIEKQLIKAGIRMAGLLDFVFKNGGTCGSVTTTTSAAATTTTTTTFITTTTTTTATTTTHNRFKKSRMQ